MIKVNIETNILIKSGINFGSNKYSMAGYKPEL